MRLARTLREHRDGILQAVRLGLSNGRLEGLNSKVRLISHRSFGFHSAAALIALVYLCCGGIEVELPLSWEGRISHSNGRRPGRRTLSASTSAESYSASRLAPLEAAWRCEYPGPGGGWLAVGLRFRGGVEVEVDQLPDPAAVERPGPADDG